MCNSQHSATWEYGGCFSLLCCSCRSRWTNHCSEFGSISHNKYLQDPYHNTVPRGYRPSAALEKDFIISAAIFCSPKNSCVLVNRSTAGGAGTSRLTPSILGRSTHGFLHTRNETALKMTQRGVGFASFLQPPLLAPCHSFLSSLTEGLSMAL